MAWTSVTPDAYNALTAAMATPGGPGDDGVAPPLPTYGSVRTALDKNDAAMVRPYWIAAAKVMADMGKWRPVANKPATTIDIDFNVPGMDAYQRMQWLDRLSGGIAKGYSFAPTCGSPNRYTVTLVDPRADDGQPD